MGPLKRYFFSPDAEADDASVPGSRDVLAGGRVIGCYVGGSAVDQREHSEK